MWKFNKDWGWTKIIWVFIWVLYLGSTFCLNQPMKLKFNRKLTNDRHGCCTSPGLLPTYLETRRMLLWVNNVCQLGKVSLQLATSDGQFQRKAGKHFHWNLLTATCISHYFEAVLEFFEIFKIREGLKKWFLSLWVLPPPP